MACTFLSFCILGNFCREYQIFVPFILLSIGYFCIYTSNFEASLGDSGKESTWPVQEMWVWFLGQEDTLEKEMATHFMENPMDTEAWQATVHGVTRVEHDLAIFFSFLEHVIHTLII